MRLINLIAEWFIDFFGITHPTGKQRRTATFFIMGLLVLSVCGLFGAFLLISHVVGHGGR